jgi:hypothetical protein
VRWCIGNYSKKITGIRWQNSNNGDGKNSNDGAGKITEFQQRRWQNSNDGDDKITMMVTEEFQSSNGNGDGKIPMTTMMTMMPMT